MQRINWTYRIAFVLFMMFAIMILSSILGCQSAKQFMRSNDFAKACADSFPAIDTIIDIHVTAKTDTVLVAGDTIIILDSVTLPGGVRIDTIRKACPPSKLITNTIVTERQIIRVDSAKVVSVQKELLFTKSELQKFVDKTKKRSKVMWLSLLGNILLLVLIGFVLGKKLKL